MEPQRAALPAPLADFGARVVSFCIDSVAPIITLVAILLFIVAKVGSEVLIPVLSTVAYLGFIAFAAWNSGYLQGTTGQSIGRRAAKTKLVKIDTGQPVGFGLAMLRQICHVTDIGVGYLWPLWDAQRQTFADKIVDTVVIQVDHDDGADNDDEDNGEGNHNNTYDGNHNYDKDH